MSSRTFGRGFLADKLYSTEDAVPAGTFEQIQRRRKRRRPLGWLLPSLALVVLMGIGGYLYRGTGSRVSSNPVAAGVSQPEAKSSVSSRTIADAPAQASQNETLSENAKRSPDTRTSSARAVPAAEQTSTARTAPPENPESSTYPGRTESFPTHTQARRTGSEFSAVATGVRNPAHTRIAQQEKDVAPIATGESPSAPFVSATQSVTGTGSGQSKAEMPPNPGLAYDLGVLEASQVLDSRLTPLALQPHEASPLAVYPVGVNRNLFSRLKLTEVLIDFGPTALTQKVRFTERNFSPEQGKFSTLYTEPGIGLEAGITVRSQLSPWLGLLAGVRSRIFWQTVSGKVKTSESSPVTYTSIDAFTVQAQPQLVEQGYTLKSTIWMPIIPELLLEFRPPNAMWGIAAGGYLNAYPQSFLSYRGQGAPAAPFSPGAALQPVAQIWTQTSRTRLTLSVRRIQGSDLMPHPVHSTSDGLLTSATMSYRFGW